MQNLKEYFSHSMAEEIVPDLSFQKISDSWFALILDSCETISQREIEEIKERTGLLPLFLDISQDSAREQIHSRARGLCAPVIRPRSKTEFGMALQKCNFSISEDIFGAFFSFLSDTPSYVNAGDEKCRKLIGESAKWNISSEIFVPYTKNRTAIIRRPVVYNSDFSLVKNKFRAEIDAKFKSIF